jgi:hypothetical protein
MNWFRNEIGKAQRGEFRPKPVPPPGPPPVREWPRDVTDRELLEDLWRKVSKLTPKEM